MASVTKIKKRQGFKYLEKQIAQSLSNVNGDLESSEPPVKRKKVGRACVYCKRSHMTCDSERPCRRCVRRSIADMCCDEEKAPAASKSSGSSSSSATAPHKSSTTVPFSNNSAADYSIHGESPIDSSNHSASSTKNDESSIPAPSTGSKFGDDTFSPSPSNTSLEASNFLPSEGHANFFGDISLSQDPQPIPSLSWLGSATIETPKNSTEYYSPLRRPSGSLEDPQTYSVDELMFGLQGLANSDITTFPWIHNGNPTSDVAPRPKSSQDSFVELTVQKSGSTTASDANMALQSSFTNLTHESASSGDFEVPIAVPLQNPTKRPPSTTLSSLPSSLLFVSAEMATCSFDVRPWNYTYSYARLNRYMSTNWSETSIGRATAVINVVRPRFLRISHERSDIELMTIEKDFECVLRHYENCVFNVSPAPMLLWRRTGDIVAASVSFATLLNIPKSVLGKNSTLCIYELLDEDSSVRMLQDYGAYCDQYLSQAEDTMLPVHSTYTFAFSLRNILDRTRYQPPRILNDAENALNRDGMVYVKCAISFKPLMDKFGVPLVIACSFVPIIAV